MKVLLGHCFYRSSAPSGEDSVYLNERSLLSDHGVDLVRYEKFNDDIPNQNLRDRLAVAASCVWSRDAYRELRTLLAKTRPDVAHFHNTFPQQSPSVYAACRDEGVPVVQTLHNYRFVCPGGLLLRENKPCEDCLGGNLLPALQHRCYRESLPATATLVANILLGRANGSFSQHVHRYIALTKFARERFIAGGLPADRICVKPNFSQAAVTTASKKGYAIYVGRVSNEKGVVTLINAWASLPNIPLLVVGDGPLRLQLEAAATANGNNVTFLGQRSKQEVLDLVSAARIQIVPSECYEGFPMVVLEAFAHGTPVLASNIGSLQEIVLPGRNGFLFNPADSADLQQSVTNLWDDEPLLLRVADNAKAEFVTRYSPDNNFSQLMSIYAAARDEFGQNTSSTRLRSEPG